MTKTEPVEPMIKQLPPDLQKEAIAYIKRLMRRSRKPVKRKLSLNWAGELEDLRDTFTSVELQHEITNWWT